MTLFNGAVSRHRMFSPYGYNVPKVKFLYYVNFVTTNLDSRTQSHLGFFVKKVDRLQMNYEVVQMNQYNKKRLVQTKLEYGPLNFVLHDTADGTAFKLIEAYNRFHFGDFAFKNNSSWSYDVVGSNFESQGDWGLTGRLSPNASYFIERIEIFEMYNSTYSQLNFIHPKFTSVEMGGLASEESGANDVSISCKYEGVVFHAINAPVTYELAEMWGLPFHNNYLSALLGGLNIPGFDISSGVGLPGQSLLSSIANIINNNANGGKDSTLFNTVNSILNGQLPRIISDNKVAQTINGIFGATIGGGQPIMDILNPISSLSNILPAVQNLSAVGDAVRNISSGSFDVLGPLETLFGF